MAHNSLVHEIGHHLKNSSGQFYGDDELYLNDFKKNKFLNWKKMNNSASVEDANTYGLESGLPLLVTYGGAAHDVVDILPFIFSGYENLNGTGTAQSAYHNWGGR